MSQTVCTAQQPFLQPIPIPCHLSFIGQHLVKPWYVLLQAVDAVLGQHLHELERTFKQSLDSRHLSMSSGAAAGAAAAGGAGAGGPGGARGLVLPTPGAAGSWQVGALLGLACSLHCVVALGCWKNRMQNCHAAGVAAGAAAAGGAGAGGPGGAWGLVLPTPGAAGSWQVGAFLV
jgi:hypothetical protein